MRMDKVNSSINLKLLLLNLLNFEHILKQKWFFLGKEILFKLNDFHVFTEILVVKLVGIYNLEIQSDYL